MSNQGEYPEDNRVGKHEPHDLSLTRRDLIKVSAAQRRPPWFILILRWRQAFRQLHPRQR
ncbi:hypothetical protein HPE39_04935 [Escherichia coli]|nr:hypothetical protein HPE39_04935 [Escherichia coli]